MMSSAFPQHHAADGSEPRDAVAPMPARKTLSIRAGAAVRGSSEDSKAASGKVPQAHSANLAQNGAIPLKRRTAGRKEMKIAHDGATYVLRVTKSNKLILTKEAAAALAAVTS